MAGAPRNMMGPNSTNEAGRQYYFADKLIIVTGATSGIGKSVATWFLEHGAKVGVVGRNEAVLSEFQDRFPDQAFPYRCDLTIQRERDWMVNTLKNQLGGLDILINAAGIIRDTEVDNIDPQTHDLVVNTNLKATFNITQQCMDDLIRSRGIVVNVSCVWGKVAQPGLVSYCIAKAGIEQLTKTLALEFASHGVRVNAVAPSAMNESMFMASGLTASQANKTIKAMSERNPAKRSPTNDEVTKAIVFLCGPRSMKVTGEILSIDGGLSISSNLHVDWEGSYYMDSKFAPKGNNTLPSFLKWVKEAIFDKISPPSHDEIWMHRRHRQSNWATQHADAHYKVTDLYDHMRREENAISYYEQVKDEEGAIFTDLNPRPAERKLTKEIPKY